MGSVPGPHTRTPRSQETRATGPGYLPQGWAAGRGGAPNPTRPSQRREEPPPPPPPPGQPPANPAARNAQQGMPAKGPVLGPNACAPAPRACGQRAPTAWPKDRQPGEGERLTPDAPHKGTRRPPPPGMPCCHLHRVQRQLARACAVGSVPGPHNRTPRAQETRATGNGYLPQPLQGRAAGRGGAPNPTHPSQRREDPPSGDLPPLPQ